MIFNSPIPFIMTDNTANKNKLLDFSFVEGNQLSIDDMLEIAYNEGQKDVHKNFKKGLEKNLQTAAALSSLFKKKLSEREIMVENMFLRILSFSEFECLVLISDKDYYTKSKRWEAYNISRNLNANTDEIDIQYSLMPGSEEVNKTSITSEGFYFKYASEK